ncbi:MAG: sigma 54-interacting transcriptional regulator [Deltaproteobacteria bacterium]|nr:sigma 54-interacting transcriptional regulator [Deltaproteobacteria bacterium]
MGQGKSSSIADRYFRSEEWAQPFVQDLFSSPLALSVLLDSIPVGVAVLDDHRRLLYFNQYLESLTGFHREQVWGLPCCDVLRADVCPRRCPSATKTSGSDAGSSLEGDIINKDRRKIPVRLSSIPLFKEDGSVLGYMEVVEDIRLLKASETAGHAYSFGEMIGHSPKMEELFRIMPVIAQTDSSVLITGETGTGKDLAAEAIHQASERAREPFIKINCCALPDTLLESELFGHIKGAFTGAVSDKPGRMRLGHKGTVYLTEVGDLPLSLQVKLLTFLDDKIIYPLGGTKGFQADVRVIAATHRPLERMVRDGHFREDLLFRLNVVRLHLPPLREREGDIDLLMGHFLGLFSGRFHKKINGFSEKAEPILKKYAYPGNVRELRNAIEYAVNICQDERIRPEHLPAYMTAPQSSASEPGTPVMAGPSELLSTLSRSQGTNWPEMERQMIINALIQAKGRKNKAASALGWGRSTLWRKINQHGLEP